MTAIRGTGWFGRDARQGLGRPASWLACALSVPLLLAALVIAPASPPVGASETPLISETFTGANVATPSSWVEPTAPKGYTNAACLTAGTAAASRQQPIPGCANPAVDPAGAGVLRLNGAQHNQVGGVMTTASVPASSGLDATFESYQWGGNSGDGMGFDLAAENPSNPAAPTVLGQRGGGLAYASGHAAGAQGLAYGYLGVGLDSYGNYSNPLEDGSGCTDPSWDTGQTPRQVVVRGPGNGGVGYCLLNSSAVVLGGSQSLQGSARASSGIPVEVVINTTSGPVDMTASGFTGVSVPSGDYGVAWTPIGGSPKSYTGALPTVANGGIPSGLYPSGWVNPSTGVPYQLGFGWGAATGSNDDNHEISNVVANILQPAPVLTAAISDSDNGRLQVPGTVNYTVTGGVATGSNESDPIKMTTTLPSGVTPGAATGTGWSCVTAGQVVTCTYTAPIAAGTTLPAVTLPATVAQTASTAPGALSASVTVSSNDGTSATATDAATGVALPATLQQVTLSASVPSAAAGIGTIGLDNNGNLPTVTQQTSTTGTSSTGLNGSPNAAIASTKMATLKFATLKFATLKLATLKFATLKLATLKFATLTIGSQSVAPLSQDLLSNIGVTYPDGCAGSACTDWQGILAGSQYADFPLQSVSLQDVLNTTGSDAPDNSNPAARLNALPLSDIDVSGSSLGALPVAAYALGGTSIDEIPLSSADLNSDGSVNEDQTLTDWCNDLAGVQWPCSDFGITSDTDTTDAANVTVLSLGISGVPLASIPLDSVPLQSGTVDASPVGALSLAGTDLNDTGLGTLKLATLKFATLKFATLKFATLPIDQVNTASIALGSIPLTDINMAEDIPLSDGTTGPIPLGGIALSAIPNVASIVKCSLTPDNCATDTLAQAQSDSAILPTAVLSDVSGYDSTTTVAEIEAAISNGYTDTTTLADLLGAEEVDSGTTIAQFIDAITSNDPSALNGLYFGDLLAGLVPQSTYPWQDVNLATPGLAAASTGGGELTLTATTKVANGPVGLTDVFTVPAGFSLVPGSALFDGQPAPDPAVSGSTLTATPGNSTGTDTYSFDVRPNEVLGAQQVSVMASLATGGSSSANASVNVTDPFAGNGSATTPSTLQPDSLNVSFLSAPNVAAYWDINVPAGDALSLDLSDLPADYDMVLYGPPTTELSGNPTQNTAGVTETPPADQSSDGQQDAPDDGTLPLLATLPVEAISANRGLTPEEITTPSLTGGTYLVQISGYNGAYSATAPYVLRSELIETAASPSCSVPNTYANDALTQNVAVPAAGQPLTETWSASSGWSLQAPPSNVNTLFLVDPDRLYDAYGQSSSGGGQPGVNDVLQQLTSTINSGAGGMVGAIVPVEGNPQTAADYSAWDANACSVQAANQVVSDISATVRGLEAAYPTIANIVIIGADDQIPMGRVPDMTVSDNEADYAASTFPGISDQLSSALSQGYFLSDDPYASPDPLGVGGQTLYTPSLAIGRLVETPTQIDNALSRFQSSNGQLTATSALSTGYDFVTQAANAVAASLSGPLGAANVQSLISDSWTTSDLLNAIDGGTPTSPKNAPDIVSFNGHFDFSRLLSANGDETGDPTQILGTGDVRAADAGNEITQERLLFSLGCHSGLEIPTNEVSNVVPGGVDSWASTFADEGAIWVGNTGYGYANDQYISYSAKLMGLFAQNLNGSVSIGDALSEAKQLYAAQSGVLDPYDLKADMESTYYGMPNYTLSGLAKPVANSAAATTPLSLGQDPATGLQTAPISLNQSVGTNPNQLGTVTPPEGGTYYEVNNSTLEQTTAGFPIEPLSSIDVTIPGANGGLASVAHGALITGLGSSDYGDFTPSIAEADSDSSGPENQISQYETSFPATLQRVATYQLFNATGAPVTHQAVDLITGQFIPDPNNPGTGNQRLFTNISANVEYTSPSDTQFTPPTIDEATAVVSGSTAAFNVVTTPAPGGAPVKEVLVLFTDSANPGTWTPVSLSQGADGAWTGGAAAPASGQVDYIVQAVDGDGNVAMDSDKGVEFTQVPESQVQSTGLGGLSASLSPAQSAESTYEGFYNGPVVVTFSGAPGAIVTYQVDGGSSQTVTLGGSGQGSFTVTSDGTHVITASDTGNQISQVVKIDTTGPTISSSVSAPHSGNGWTSGGTTLTISASDAGSGVASLTYQVGGGSPTPVTGPITPPSGITTYDVTATDFLGNTSTATITTQVDATAPSSIMCTPAVAPTTWFSTDQSVTCTGTDTQSGIAGGTSSTGSVTLSTSVPAGTATSNASTSSGQLCDNVVNCTPIPAITGFMIDKTAPAVSCPSAGTTWSTGTVTFTCTVTDSGSGVAADQAGVSLTNQSGTQATVTLTASAPAGTTNPNTSTNSVQVCNNVGTCVTAGPITGVMIDNAPPTVNCPSADTNWHKGTVSFTCTASDSGSGLAADQTGVSLTNQSGTQATVTLTASAPAGTTNPDASTNSVQVCDNVGACVMAGPISNVKIDNQAPIITTSVSAPHSGNGWTSAGTTLTVSASDAGSGLASLTYQVGGGAATPVTGPITPPSGITTYTIAATDAVGNASTATVTTKVDTVAPTVSCPSADTNWHSGTVSFTCTATDSGSGLANPAQATITLTTPPIAPGTSNPSVSTNSVSVCDNVGNCATAGPIKNVKIDNTAPTVSITNPTNNAVYMLNQPEAATFTCADPASGISSCSAVTGTTTLSSGGTLPTTQVGSHTITVTAISKTGVTTAQTYTYVVTYKLCNFIGPVEPLGIAVVFSVTLCNYSGTNVGSSGLTITALNIDGTKTLKAGSTFSWSSAFKVYAYAMSTSGLTTGSHVLNVSVTGDPVTHPLSFTVKS